MRSAFTSLQSLTKEQCKKKKEYQSRSNQINQQKGEINCMISIPEVFYGWKLDIKQKNGKQDVEIKTVG
ncbi:unnamed protein product [Paramecium octaurelia]|uniref:Uncharacterized protein n=1 Tax=Paramecium octaurelia TaxID=43137 RepID=A0A8S1Y6Z2_PAROT|nr:unnamed protein product [Paramecium octaurelia]